MVTELSRLLEMQFIDKASYQTPIGKSLKMILDSHNRQRYDDRDYELWKMLLLVRNLKDIEKHDMQLFKRFKLKIRKSHTFDNFFGTRFEVIICSTFIRNSISFELLRETNTQMPDFMVHMNRDIFVECTTSHLSQSKSKDFGNKIRAAIDDKSAKEYNRPDTALFIDPTHIFFHSLQGEKDLQEDIPSIVNERMSSVNFGSILIFRYIVEPKKQRFTHGYVRFDNNKIDQNLLEFLNKYFPLGEYRTDDNYKQPSWG